MCAVLLPLQKTRFSLRSATLRVRLSFAPASIIFWQSTGKPPQGFQVVQEFWNIIKQIKQIKSRYFRVWVSVPALKQGDFLWFMESSSNTPGIHFQICSTFPTSKSVGPDRMMWHVPGLAAKPERLKGRSGGHSCYPAIEDLENHIPKSLSCLHVAIFQKSFQKSKGFFSVGGGYKMIKMD